MGRQPNGCHNHGADLHDLGPNGDLALAETVRKPAAGHAEDDEGNGEHQRDDGDEGLALLLREVHANDHREQQVAEDVVAVGALELRGDEGPESARAARRFSGCGGRFAGENGVGCGHKGML